MKLFRPSSFFRVFQHLLLLSAALAAALGAGLWRLAAIILLLLLPPVHYCYCLFRLKELSRSGLEDAADFIMGPGAFLAGMLQRRAEILPFLKETFPAPPSAVAEIGRAKGGTLLLLCRAAAPDALIISLDLPGAIHSGPVPAMNRGAWRLPLLKAMAGPGQDLRLIDGDSKLPSSAAQFEAALGGRGLDLLFIDGDHTWDGVKSDLETYSRFVKPGGVIAFHDIQPGPEELGGAVSRFWKELSLPGTRKEYIERPSQTNFGIGVLRLPG